MTSADSKRESIQEIHEDLRIRISDMTLLLMVVFQGQRDLQETLDEADEMTDGGGRNPNVFKVTLQMSCVYVVVLLEEMLRGYVSFFYHERPASLSALGDKKSKVVSYKKILSTLYHGEIVEGMVEKELYRFSQNIDEIEEKYFDGLFNHRLSKEFDNWDVIRRIYYLRNLIVHEHSIMNEDTYKKIDGDIEPGDKIQIVPNDVTYACEALHKLNTHVHNVVADKLKLDKI